MKKQQLAAKIWESANKMRSKIEANDYKDYILGFIFYKYLSDKELEFLKSKGLSEVDMKALSDDEESIDYVRASIGYFIAYNNLFSTWLKMGRDFDVSNVTDALSAFNRLISTSHRKVFEGIFNTLETGLSKLGDSAASRTKAISDLIHLIQDIPTDERQAYDVLGFIYEYLIGMFAAGAGKKAGEFYTPHEVSLLMSELVSYHLKDRTEIKIYDPTSGSGSLLINIGYTAAKHIEDKNKIKYYAQELKQNTYNLTRMNLIMRGIIPDNIATRNADTLEDDWPYFDESDPIKTYAPLYVDAVVSNPPYSQQWNPYNKETDPRYSRFGLAPKSAADYAFLLHDLYHVKPDGIMTIVLPHGVLFRGGDEGKIRKNLIEYNHIDTIIGLPANIFFGTSIPTIIMVLKQRRENTDVLIIDASLGFVKDGKSNKLRASDIKKIADTVAERTDIHKFSRKIPRDEIRANDYNLNIPRYIDSSKSAEKWDIYASMFGGIPADEAYELSPYWDAFSGLEETLFIDCSAPYKELKDEAVKDIYKAVNEHPSVRAYVALFHKTFSDFYDFLKDELILCNMQDINISKEKDVLSCDIFARLEPIQLIDKYLAYQILHDDWEKISSDLEIIQTEGFLSVKKVDPKMVIKKRNGRDEEIQDGFEGRIIPFELVWKTLLSAEYDAIKQKEKHLSEIISEYEEILESFTEEEKSEVIADDEGSEIKASLICEKARKIRSSVITSEIEILQAYLAVSSQKDIKGAELTEEKINFISRNNTPIWDNMATAKDGTYSEKDVASYILSLQYAFEFPMDSFEERVIRAYRLTVQESDMKAKIKDDKDALNKKTKKTIEGLSDSDALYLLEEKWIVPLYTAMLDMSQNVVSDLTSKLKALTEKYSKTYASLEAEIKETELALCALIDELSGSEYDMKGLSEFQALLKGE